MSGPTDLISFIDSAEIVIHPIDTRTARPAAQAWSQFGKGRHPAGPNCGDCFSYALARHLEVPLLCVGSDFRQTDVVVIP